MVKPPGWQQLSRPPQTKAAVVPTSYKQGLNEGSQGCPAGHCAAHRRAANLFTRNFWKAYLNPGVTALGEAKVAKMTSLALVVGALLFILYLPTQFALDLQLLGGLWILQTLPAVTFGLYTGWFRAHGLLAGWAVGFLGGSWLAWLNGFKPLHTLHFGAATASRFIPACWRLARTSWQFS
jgi:hypothetical protein